MVPVARLIFRSSPGEEADGLAVGRPEGELDALGPGQHPGGRRLERARPQHRGRVLGRIVLRSGLGNGPEHDLAAVGRHDRPAPEVEAPTVGRIDHEPASGRPRRRRPPKLGDRERHRDAPQDDRDGGPGPPLLPSSLALRFGRDRGLGARAFSRGASSGEHVLQLEPGRSDVGQPRARVLAQAPAQEPAHCRRRRLRQRVEVGLLRHDGGDHVGDGVPGEERPAGQHLPQQHAEGPHVGPLVDRLAPRLLGRHVGRGAQDHPRDRSRVGEGGRLREGRRARVHARRLARPRLGEAEVEDLYLALGRQLHIRRLEVPVDDALVVGLLERLRDLLGDLEGLVDGDRAPREPLLEVLPLDELEGEEGLPVGLLEPVDRGDVRVVEGGEEVGLALEAPQALFVLRHLGRQHLDRDVPVEVRVGGAVDLAHPPGPESRGDLVVRQGLSDQGRAPPGLRDARPTLLGGEIRLASGDDSTSGSPRSRVRPRRADQLPPARAKSDGTSDAQSSTTRTSRGRRRSGIRAR